MKLTWNPKNGDGPHNLQSEALLNVSQLYVSGDVSLRPWEPTQGQHFHDRIIHIREDETKLHWRVDVTSGIDNLMSHQKECNLFIEKL